MKSRTLVMVNIAIFGALAFILMLFKTPIWVAPNFYELDMSEIPVIIGAFAMGPIAGVMIELIKILLKLVIQGSSTTGVGELANLIIGISFVVPASCIYRRIKTKSGAIFGLLVGSLSMTIVGALANYFLLLPFYAYVYKAPIQTFIDLGNKVNSNINSLETFVLFAVVPFNIVKSLTISIVVFLLYKPLRRIMKIVHLRLEQ